MQDQQSISASPSKIPVIHTLNKLFLLGAILCGVFHQVLWAEVLIGAWFVIKIPDLYRGKQPAWLKETSGRLGPFGGLGLVLILWLAFSAVTLTFPSFSWMFPAIKSLPFQQSFWMLLIFFIGLVLAFRMMPRVNPNAELSSTVARYWLFAVFVLTAVMNLHHASTPVGTFWDDSCADIADIQRIKDLADFRPGGFIFDYGKRPPLFDYYVILILKFLPGASSLFIMHFASTLCNLGTVWLLYLAGKEIGGRKTGVLAAAFGAVSKPLLQWCVLGMNIVFIPFSEALALLFFFRLMKKPDMRHFLQWGAAISFGIYTYSTYRHFIPLFIFGVFLWILFQKDGRNLEKHAGLVIWATAATFFIYFLYTNHAFPADNWIARMIDVSGPFLPCLALVGLLLLTIFALPKMMEEGKSSKWLGWLAGSWLCVILSFPIMANENIISKMDSYVLVQGQGILNGSYLLQTFERLKTTFLVLFWRGDSMNINAMPGDPFFGFGEEIVIALGLAFFFARPNWKRGFIFIAAVFGFLPHAILGNPHAGRLLGCIVPFFLLGALGLNELLNGLLLLPKGRSFYTLACILLLGLWGWSANASIVRVFDQWSEKDLSKHVLARQEALKDQALGYRIYYGNNLFSWIANPLSEGNKIYLWSQTNLIDLAPNDKPQDVVVILGPDTTDDKGQLLKDQLVKNFPTAQWTDIHSPTQNPTDGPILLRCFIPYSDISANPGPFFQVRQAPTPCWDRRYSTGEYGLAFDLIDYEDKVANATDPIPPQCAQIGKAAQYVGTVHVSVGGKYDFNWKTANRTEVWIDGRTLLNLYFPQTRQFTSPERSGTAAVNLEAGDHKVEVMTCFQQTINAPDLSIAREGAASQGRSLWSSFNF